MADGAQFEPFELPTRAYSFPTTRTGYGQTLAAERNAIGGTSADRLLTIGAETHDPAPGYGQHNSLPQELRAPTKFSVSLTVPCTLFMTYDVPRGEDIEEEKQQFELQWANGQHYSFTITSELRRFAQKAALNNRSDYAEQYFYFRYGHIRVKSRTSEVDLPLTVEAIDDTLSEQIYSELAPAIGKLIFDHNQIGAEVEIRMNVSSFEAISPHTISARGPRNVLKSIIWQKTRRVSDKSSPEYISRADLLHLLKVSHIASVLRDPLNKCQHVLPDKLQDLADKIFKSFSRLFVASAAVDQEHLPCLMQSIMTFKESDLESFEDRDVNKIINLVSDQVVSHGQLSTILGTLPKFNAVTLKIEDGYRLLSKDQIVPYKQIGSVSSGDGASGEVFKIKIDPVHHNFSSDRNAAFALKRCKSEKLTQTNSFKRESAMLSKLRRRPHPHLIEHFASIQQGHELYIILPFAAHGDLRKYINDSETRRQFDFDKNHDQWLWFCQQIHGLAGALHCIHRDVDQDTSSENNADQPRDVNKFLSVIRDKSKTEVGYHHDLKLDNVLVFWSGVFGRPTFKIADFGSGKIQLLSSTGHSHQTNPICSKAYEPPEGRAGRKADTWAFGCVLAELLACWVHPRYPTTKRFDAAREETDKHSRFWTSGQGQKKELKLKVITALAPKPSRSHIDIDPEVYVLPGHPRSTGGAVIRDNQEDGVPVSFNSAALMDLMRVTLSLRGLILTKGLERERCKVPSRQW